MDDKQFCGNSLKVNAKGSGSNGSCRTTKNGAGPQHSEEPTKQEFYKPISEDNLLPPVKHLVNSDDVAKTEVKTTNSSENGDPKMVQEDNNVNDGADEQMLGADDHEKLAEKREEVKFIKGDQLNGDAKIDIGTVNGKSFTGMTKEELMKYANDPFWVRLRWIFFVAFWAIWVAMLVGAILIIVQAPKCAAPEPLHWYKQGPLAKFKSVDAENGNGDLKLAESVSATGAIYELPAELTYSVKDPAVEQKIKDIVARYKDSEVNVILDITPNYVNKDSHLMKNALADETKRSAFIWIESPGVPNNWLSVVNGSAWSEVQPGNFVLSQFGDGLYDLHMNDTIVKKELTDVLAHLMQLGVKGFRLKNSKFFLISKTIEDEVPSNDPRFIHTQYGFWTHTQTTFQEGLGDVLYDYMVSVKNISANALFSVAEDVIRPEVYQNRVGEYGIDLPIYGRFTHSLSHPQGKKLQEELQSTFSAAGNNSWLQWNYEDLGEDSPVNPSAYGLFLALLPGVPVVPVDSVAFTNTSDETYKHIEQLRSSASYKYGDFEMYSAGGNLTAYSRIKSGNPGYFVVFNPSEVDKRGNFSSMGLPDKMSVVVVSENYNVSGVAVKTKVMTDSVEVSSYATIILTYVPVQSG